MLQPNVYAQGAVVGIFSFEAPVFHSFFVGMLVLFA